MTSTDRSARAHTYYDFTISVCSTCLRRVDAKIVFDEGGVWMLKRCPDHGAERVLVADDVDYYKRCREVFIKPSEQPLRFNTPVKYGCPYDCGLCTDHEQHACLSIVEVTDACNLRCPVCYAESGPERAGEHRSLDTVIAMLDAVVANEGEPDVVQISGGEPTLHPDFFAILDAARARPIRHLMVNTNGIRIANEDGFAERLAEYAPGFEVYLQFDSLREDPLRALRGADLRATRAKALDRLDAVGLSTTLVVTLARGVNTDEVGDILAHALEHPAVRGVTFQPIQRAGRVEGISPDQRLTLTEVRRMILEQSDIFRPEDVIPVPCHPDAIAMAYALRTPAGTIPLTGSIDPEVLLQGGRNTIVFEQEDAVRDALFEVFSTAHSPESSANALADLLCCLPRVSVPDASTALAYDRVFRVIIMQFQDAAAFDVRSVKKSCVHFVQPDGKSIPFDTFNLFYRGEREREVLAALRNP